jgi:tRNA pseudouridine55 synthase
VVDKPAGLTSHDVVARVRHAVGGGKVGHAGTLDPFATGVLVVCLGRATRLAEWASAADKRYRAEIVLGVETDTYDLTGQVLATVPVDLESDQVEAALARFVGETDQRPPAYSAIQVGGRRLYDMARRGEAVEVEPRRVTIQRLDLIDWSPPRLTVDLSCSKGTYVRSLAHDLGAALGTGAHLGALRRLASGDVAIEQAGPLDEAVAAIRAGQGAAMLRDLDTAVSWMPRIEADADALTRLQHGQPIDAGPPMTDGTLGRAYGADGQLAAVAERRVGQWWPTKVLAQ